MKVKLLLIVTDRQTNRHVQCNQLSCLGRPTNTRNSWQLQNICPRQLVRLIWNGNVKIFCATWRLSWWRKCRENMQVVKIARKLEKVSTTNPTTRIPNSSCCCCSSQKAPHPDISETESGIIDPLVSKRPEKIQQQKVKNRTKIKQTNITKK